MERKRNQDSLSLAAQMNNTMLPFLRCGVAGEGVPVATDESI